MDGPKDQLQNNQSAGGSTPSGGGTMVPGDSETLKGDFDPDSEGGTMIQHATLTNDKSEPESSGSMIEIDQVDLGTMVINEDDDDTMQSKFDYATRPKNSFMFHR